jgi:hypothetical protein
MTFLSHHSPPPAYSVDREAGGVVIGTDADPSHVVIDIINTIWYSALQLWINKVVNLDLVRRPFSMPFFAIVLGKQLIMPDVWINLMQWLPSDIHFIH